MTGNLEDQTKRTMDGIKQTFDAAPADGQVEVDGAAFFSDRRADLLNR
jgi:hypothetical protein